MKGAESGGRETNPVEDAEGGGREVRRRGGGGGGGIVEEGLEVFESGEGEGR